MEQRNASAAVIGAGDYIGGAIAKKFAAEGFTVFGGRRQGDKLAPLVAEVEANGGRIYARSLDARKEDDLTGASWVPAKCRPARRWNHRNREQRILRHFCTQPRPVAFCQGRTKTASVGRSNTGLLRPQGIAVDSGGKIYVANRNSTVTVYPAGSNGNALPAADIGFYPNNGMDEPAGIALDGAGNIYVTNLNPFGVNYSYYGINPAIYPAGSGATGATLLDYTTNIVPYPSLATGIVLDSSQNVYIAEASAVDIFSPINAGLSPLGTLHGDTTQMSNAAGIALDASANIYLTNDASDILGDRVTIYPAESTGNMAPSAVIAGSNTGLAFPAGIAVDSSLNIYVANKATDAVTVYAPGSNGNVAPSKTISGPSTGLDTPSGIAIDSSGLIYVTNEGGYEGGNLSVTVYAAGSSGNATPVTTIAGSLTQLARPRGIAVIP